MIYFHTKDLSVGYNGHALIHDINIEVEKGKILTLIGPNGAGKSTILKSITHHLAKICGQVYICLLYTSRRRGMSLCLDFVINHTADTHPWAMRAKAGEQEYIDRYICFDTPDIPREMEKTIPDVFPETAPGSFIYQEDMKKYVCSSFHPYQWDLNYRNPAVFNDMVCSMLHLANLGVEILRIDAVPYLWKEMGTSCRNLPKVHTIMRMIRLIIETVCPAVILKGEVVMAPKELAPYFGTQEKPECHLLYNASTMATQWSALASADVRQLKRCLLYTSRCV